ncbi:Serine palmitoyltransferase 1 [Zancudomyces culisetae]|uniref:serine C-palmitoyltransferase n=1 Tax=Zancudomyces culisetae TaxID=1213189 RepID=A0A1R1PGT7_ZANCU|nr:Serine palmitoyltransferase 1 [Zancudomyces culisetae]|eukprot:OMH80158.1 Serine palmitoyltransferase 1 [Zancudomyces culisetae]
MNTNFKALIALAILNEVLGSGLEDENPALFQTQDAGKNWGAAGSSESASAGVEGSTNYKSLVKIIGFPFRLFMRYIRGSYKNDPFRTFLELCLVVFFVWYVSRQKYKMNQNDIKLTEKEIDELVQEWKPEPLVPGLSKTERLILDSIPVIDGQNGVEVRLKNGDMVDNFSNYDYLGFMSNNEKAREKAVKTLRNYGVGACGPPGFYGTLDVHMELEKKVAEFMGAEAAIIYSQGMATGLSVIPCFSKRDGVIVADSGVNFVLQQGIQLSRSKVFWYKHNDMEDLENVLTTTNKYISKIKGPTPKKFIVTEGLFTDTGSIVNLPKILELKKKYKYRLILDDSAGIGALGARGAGVLDYYYGEKEGNGKDGVAEATKEVEILLGSLWQAFGGSGGFCCAAKELIGHQRLSGLGYVFSASMPAIMAVTASDAISRLAERDGDGRLALRKLNENISYMRQLLEEINNNNNKSINGYASEEKRLRNKDSNVSSISSVSTNNDNFTDRDSGIIEIEGDDNSPIIHVHLTPNCMRQAVQKLGGNGGINSTQQFWTRQDEELVMMQLASEIQTTYKVLVCSSLYVVEREKEPAPEPSLRIIVSAGHSKHQIIKCVEAIENSINKLINNY